MKNILVLIFLLSFSLFTFGQITRTPKNITNNEKIVIKNIVGEYHYFYKKGTNYTNWYVGIAKNNEIIFPMIFTEYGYFYYDNQILLGIGDNKGIYNLETKSWDIPMKYEKINSFGQGVFSVKLSGKFGIVDKYNNLLVPMIWDGIYQVSGLGNYYQVYNIDNKNTLYGIYSLLDKKLTTPCIYSKMEQINKQNLFLVTENGKKNVINIENKKIFSQDFDDVYLPHTSKNDFIVTDGQMMGVVDINDEFLIPLEYLFISKTPFSDGSYLAKNNNNKYGCLLLDGTITLPFIYDNIGYTTKSTVLTSVKDGKCGVISLDGNSPIEIIVCEYDSLKAFISTFMVKKNGKIGILDSHGKIVTPIEYDEMISLLPFYKHELLKCKKNNKYYLLNTLGTVLSDGGYREMEFVPGDRKNNWSSSISFNYIKVKDNKKGYRIMDKTGRIIVDQFFDDVISESSGILVFKKSDKFGLFNIYSKEVILKPEYDFLIKNETGYIGIKKGNYFIIEINSEGVIANSAIEE